MVKASMPSIQLTILKRISAAALILFHFGVYGQIDCENDTTGRIPIVDLLTSNYEGYQGGLYPGGTNAMPLAHADSGVAFANSLMPINFDGEVDTMFGKTVFLALGSASAGKAFNKFFTTYQNAGYGDSCLRIINACMEEYSLRDMYGANSDNNYWKDVNDFLQIADLKKKQVQVVWLMTPSYSDTVTTTSAYIDSMHNAYVDVLRKLKNELPNVKLLFISGLQYGGYTNPLAPNALSLMEPAPYLQDFAIKSVITAQIEGDTMLRYSGDEAEAPWVAWGPNFWADGRNFRDFDMLRWLCPGDYDMDANGFLLDGGGLEKISDDLYGFFTTSPMTTPWIFGQPYDCFTEVEIPEEETIDTAVIPENEVLWITQNPVKGVVKFTIDLETDDKAQVYVFDMVGQEVSEGAFYKIEPGKVFSIKLTEDARGIYILSVFVENRVYNKLFYLDN